MSLPSAHDAVIPHFTPQEEEKLRRAYAETLYQRYTKENWWTRSSMLFYYLTALSAAVTMGMGWLILLSGAEPSTKEWTAVGVSALLLCAHIATQERIHKRFEAENPEEYNVWRKRQKRYR